MNAPHHRSAAGHQEQDGHEPASASALPVAQDERENRILRSLLREAIEYLIDAHPSGDSEFIRTCRAALSAAPQTAKGEREAVPLTEDELHAHDWWCPTCKKDVPPEMVTKDGTHYLESGGCGRPVRGELRAALSAATPPAAVPMSQKTQDGHSTSRSGEPSTTPLDITLTRDEAEYIAAFISTEDQEPGDDAVRLLVGPGHSGYGLYAAHPEYPEEGAIFIKATPSLRSAAGDQPSNEHGAGSAAPQPAEAPQDGVEGYPPDWVRLVLAVSPTGEFHALGGAQVPGDPRADRPYIGLERFKKRMAAGTEQSDTERDAARLDWLDATNKRFRMGWKVGVAPAGNCSVQAIIMGGQPIREAIDAAMDQSAGKESGE